MKIIEQSQLIKKAKNKVLEDVLKKYNLTSKELDILFFLNDNVDDTATNIVNELLFTKSHVSFSIDNLVKKGYLTTNIDNKNKKLIHLKLTDSAMPILKEACIKRNKFKELIFHNISNEDKKVMEKVFKQMNENINNILNI